MTMADRIVVLNQGRVEQTGSPIELYRRPTNLFVAGFIGSPRMNLIGGDLAAGFDAATIGIRPEHLHQRDDGPWRGILGVSEHLGADTFVHVEIPDTGKVTVRMDGLFSALSGTELRLAPDLEHLHRFDVHGKAL